MWGKVEKQNVGVVGRNFKMYGRGSTNTSRSPPPHSLLNGTALTKLFNVEITKGPSINVNIFMSVQTIHFLRPPPSPTKRVHINSAKNPHKNNKNQAKKLKVYRKNVDFQKPPRKCMVCTLVKMLTFMDCP